MEIILKVVPWIRVIPALKKERWPLTNGTDKIEILFKWLIFEVYCKLITKRAKKY